MKRGCLLGLLAFGAAVAAYDFLLRRYLDAPVHVFAALFGALFGATLIAAVVGRWRTGRDTRLIHAAERHEAPVDGRLAAIVGTVSPLGISLRSPIGDLPCVAYEYEISIDRVDHGGNRGHSRMGGRKGTNTLKLFGGVALTPSAISTRHGAVRLLSFPLMDDFEQRRSSDASSWERARRYVAGAPLQQRGLIAAMKGFAGALADDDGTVRLDVRLGKEEALPRAAWFTERVIPAGATVCAIGRYAADRRALVARGATFTRVMPGDGAAVGALLRQKTRTQFATAVVMFLVSHAFLGVATYMSATRHARDTPAQQAATIIQAVGRGDQQAIALAVQRGANPNAVNTAGEAPAHVAPDAATVRTLAGLGADVDAVGGAGRTPLMLAVLRHQPDVAQAWLDAGAKVNVARPDGATALSDAEESGDQETANILRAAGGLCDHVNAERGRLIPPAAPVPALSNLARAATAGAPTASEATTSAAAAASAADLSGAGDPVPIVRDYLAAVHQKDLARLRTLTLNRPPGFFESVDFAVWQATRPRVADGAQGYFNTEAATLTLPAFDAGGQSFTWAYQLRRAGSDWRVAREWTLPTAPADDASTGGPPAAAPPTGEDVERPRQLAPLPPAPSRPASPPARRP